jgi:hypothetical protein
MFNDALNNGIYTTGSFTNRVTAGSFVGNLTGNVTGTIVGTTGTIATLNSTTGTITTLNSTTSTITNLAATTSTFLGTITGSTNVVNIGSGQIYKDATGNVGIGDASPDSVLSVYANNKTTPAISARYSEAGFKAGLSVYNSLGFPYLSFNANPIAGSDNATYDINGVASKIDFATNSGSANIVFSNAVSGTAGSTISWSERLRIDSAGKVLIGSSTEKSSALSLSKLQIYDANLGLASNTDYLPQVNLISASTTAAAAPYYITGRSRGSIESPTAVQSGDNLGNIAFGGHDGTGYRNNSAISYFVDGAVSSNNVPTAILISTGTNGGAERFRITSSGLIGVNNSAPTNRLDIVGSFGRGAPVTKTGDFTLADTENWIIVNKGSTGTATLPAAGSWTGREFTIKTIQAFAVVSASSNVIPRIGGAAGTAILPATDGAWATLVSNGSNWEIMCGS